MAQAGDHHRQHLGIREIWIPLDNDDEEDSDVDEEDNKYLDLAEVVPPGGRGEDGEHQLADVERVPPVVVVHLHTSSWQQLLDGRDNLMANT